MPDARPTHDQVVDRVLAKAKSPLAEGDVRAVVEALEKVSRMHLSPTD